LGLLNYGITDIIIDVNIISTSRCFPDLLLTSAVVGLTSVYVVIMQLYSIGLSALYDVPAYRRRPCAPLMCYE